jgi:hypothetical protein
LVASMQLGSAWHWDFLCGLDARDRPLYSHAPDRTAPNSHAANATGAQAHAHPHTKPLPDTTTPLVTGLVGVLGAAPPPSLGPSLGPAPLGPSLGPAVGPALVPALGPAPPNTMGETI